jgi:transposase, IS5 family
MHRQMGQRGFADELVKKRKDKGRLEKISALIDWERITQLVAPIYAAPEGRPSYPPLVMVRALVLGQWYRLSDPELEDALSDRLSFRRFVGLSLEDDTPDDATLWRFRNELGKRKIDEQLFSEINDQLEHRGLFVKSGTLLDATLVQAQAAKPPYQPGQAPSTGATDPDANWTRQYRKTHFGYKAHLSVDEGSSLIRKALLTPAKVYESEVADALICGDERAVYADKAYESKARRKRLKELGIKDRLMHRRHKHQTALPRWQQKRNRLIMPIRRKVEHVFGTFKRCYGYRRVRYFSLQANATQLYLLAIAFNLRRALVLST